MTSLLRGALRQTPALANARLLRLNVLARTSAHQDLSVLLGSPAGRWSAARAAAAGPRVLIATNGGGHFGLTAIDRMLGIALTLRGAQVTHALCDAALPACLLSERNLQPDVARFAERGPSALLCGMCYAPAAKAIAASGLPLVTIGEGLTPDDEREAARIAASVAPDDVPAFHWNGLPVGEHAAAGALRFFARGSLPGEAGSTEVLRRYLEAAVLTACAYTRLFDRVRPDVVVAHHGIYAPQGVVTAVARARGIRVVTWNPAYRRHSFIFSHDDTYHHTLMDEPVERWLDAPFGDTERTTTREYLQSRRAGAQDWIRFHAVTTDAPPVHAALGLDPQRPVIAAFTNVFWDAQLHYPANAFRDQREWLVETVAWAKDRPDVSLVIRVHPAEVTGTPPSRQRAADEIARAFPELPPNVTVVPPESALSSYALADAADTVLVFGTKMAVELSAVGIPVIVAGEAWVRNKGVTRDARSRKHYRELLAELPLQQRMPPDLADRALRYAHHFFFRRMLTIPFVVPEPGPRRFTIDAASLDIMEPGRHPGLDVVTEGILRGAAFEMPSP